MLYSGKKETESLDPLLAVNWPDMMERLSRDFLGYKQVKTVGLNEFFIQQKKRPLGAKLYDKLSDSDLDHLKNIDDAYKEGHGIIMVIDTDMLTIRYLIHIVTFSTELIGLYTRDN